jgi:hypothetical protein
MGRSGGREVLIFAEPFFNDKSPGIAGAFLLQARVNPSQMAALRWAGVAHTCAKAVCARGRTAAI